MPDTPLNPDALEVAVRAFQKNANAYMQALYTSDEVIEDAITAYLAVAQPESEDERIPAWHEVANHPAFNECYEEERPLLESMLGRLTELTAQPEVNSVEELDALPPESYVQGWDGFKHAKVWDGNWVLCVEYTQGSHNSESIELPARVLYRPKVNDA